MWFLLGIYNMRLKKGNYAEVIIKDKYINAMKNSSQIEACNIILKNYNGKSLNFPACVRFFKKMGISDIDFFTALNILVQMGAIFKKFMKY